MSGLFEEKTEFHRNPKYWRVREEDLDLYQKEGEKHRVIFTPVTGSELDRIYPPPLHRPQGFVIVEVKGSSEHFGDIFKKVTQASLEREKASGYAR